MACWKRFAGGPEVDEGVLHHHVARAGDPNPPGVGLALPVEDVPLHEHAVGDPEAQGSLQPTKTFPRTNTSEAFRVTISPSPSHSSKRFSSRSAPADPAFSALHPIWMIS